MPRINDSGSHMVNHRGQEVDEIGNPVTDSDADLRRTVTPYIQARHPGESPEALARRLRGEGRPQIRPSPAVCWALMTCLSREFPEFSEAGEYGDTWRFLKDCAKPLPRWMEESGYVGHNNFNASCFRHHLATMTSLMLQVDERHHGHVPDELVLLYGKMLTWRTEEKSGRYV